MSVTVFANCTFIHTVTLMHQFYISGVDAKLLEFVRNQCCNGENNYYVFWMSVELFAQHTKRMPHILLSPMACQAMPYFSTLSHKRHDFQKKIFSIKYVLIFSRTFVK